MTRPGNPEAPRRGEVWFANLGSLAPEKGAEIQKSRPVLIIGKDILNEHRRTVLVIPLATGGGNLRANPPVTVEVHCAGKVGMAVIDQLRALDKNRLMHLVETIFPTDLEAIENALCEVMQLG